MTGHRDVLCLTILLLLAGAFLCLGGSPIPAEADSSPPELHDSTPPVANAGPDQIVDEGTTVQFDGSASYDDVGIVDFTWTFTDGDLLSLFGTYPVWQFYDPGTFVVTLTVKDAADLSGTDTVVIYVQELPTPTLATHENGEKRFRIQIPMAWDVNMNYDDPDIGEVDLLAWGPRDGGYYTNILVISDSMSVSESDAFLLDLADATIDDIRSEYGSIQVMMDPTIIATVNSRAVVFSYHDDNESLWQYVGMIASDEHIRMWTIVMTADSSYAGEYDGLAEKVVASFEILPPKPQDSTPILLGIIVLIIVLIVAILGLVVWRRRKAEAERPPASIYGTKPPTYGQPGGTTWDSRQPRQFAASNTCPYCGVVSVTPSRFCPNCKRPRP